MNNILITGGAGFIGSNLALNLVQKGYRVTVLDNLSPQIHSTDPMSSVLYNSIKKKVHIIHGTVTSKKDWLHALEDQHAIVHLAAETGTGQSMYEIERYSSVNIGGTSILLDILANKQNHSIEKVIVASSRSIYGEGKYISDNLGVVYPNQRTSVDMDKGKFEPTYPGSVLPLKLVATDENSRIHPSSVYGITKQVQEQLIMTVCPAIGIAPVAFRYQNVYGPGQSLSNPYTGILSIFSSLILSGKALNIFEDGLESRDFVYIDDVVAATIAGLESDRANGEVFNVGSGIATSVLTVAHALIRHYGVEVPVNISGNYRLGDIRHNFADITKISSLLGFRPAYSFTEGIQHFCKWVQKQNITSNDRYESSLKEMKEKGLFK